MTVGYTLFSWTFTKIDLNLKNKTLKTVNLYIPRECFPIEYFSDHSEVTPVTENISGKYSNTWKLKNTLLNNPSLNHSNVQKANKMKAFSFCYTME